MKLVYFQLTILLSLPFITVSQDPISCAFCVAGVAQINQKILSSPDMQAQMGIQSSQGCDQITVKQTRQTCRLTMNNHFNAFYTNFTDASNQSPNQMCINMGMC